MSILSAHAALANELVRYSHLAYDRHLVGAAGGNLSARVPGSGTFLVTATGVALRDVSLDNVLVVDGQGKVLEGPTGLKPSKETTFHLAVYEVRPDVKAIIHVHPTYATTFAVNGRLVPTVTISAQLKLKQGKLVPLARPGSKELADLVAQSVKSSPPESSIFLLACHGMLAISGSLSDAFDFAELAEDTAKIAYLSEAASPAQSLVARGFRVLDLTATLDEQIQCYPTDPSFSKSWHTHFNEHGVYVSKLQMGAHSGTHVDAPMHFLGDGFPDMADMPVESFMGEAIAIESPKRPGQDLSVEDLMGADIRPNDIVLFHTGWDKRTSTPAFFEDAWPGLAPSLVEELLRRGVRAVGGDIASADSPVAIAAGAPAHKLAGRAGLPIFEALVNLDQLIGQRFYFLGLPLKLDGVEASPIRAVALVPQGNSTLKG